MRLVALLAVVGAALGAGIGVVLHFATRGYFNGDVGFHSFSRRYADYLPVVSGHPAWTPAVPLWAVGGLIVGAVIGGALAVSGEVAPPARARLVAAPAALGTVVGVAVGALVGLNDDQTTYHGGYSPLNAIGAYHSTLSISFSGAHTQRLFVLPVGGGLGLLAGVALGALAVLLRARVSGFSPSGSVRR